MPRRIVSLVPSLTETLADWGLRDEIVGCTQFCVEPPQLHRTASLVGGTKDFSVEAIRKLQPTHIIANREENPKEPIEVLQADYPLLVTFPRSPLEVPAMLRELHRFLGDVEGAEASAEKIETALAQRKDLGGGKCFAYFIWREPYMIAGPDTYISRFLELFGWRNAYQGEERYPALTLEALRELKADRLFFSSEPYPFRRRDATRLRGEWAEVPPIYKIDGQLMSWYGTRTLKALQTFEANLSNSL